MNSTILRSIAVVSHGYPCRVKPSWLVFVRQIAYAFARQGVQTSVICPLAIHRAVLGRDPYRSLEDAGEGAFVTVYRPRYLSMSSRQFGAFNTAHLTHRTHWLATRRCFKRHLRDVGALYGHFLYPSGFSIVRLGAEFNVPSFPAAGEISLDTIQPTGSRGARRDLEKATGFISNSTHLAGLLQRELGFGRGEVGIFPNAVNRRLFYPRDRDAMRSRWGLPRDSFLACCVGTYGDRKGQDRVCRAIDSLRGVHGVFVGAGKQPSLGRSVIFSQALPQEQLPEVLSACDIFVLPTSDEGCCNAIIEAIACGLPIVSSIGPFNDDILSDDYSIRTDPFDIDAIREAVLRLRDNVRFRLNMGREALRRSKEFDAEVRARRILGFMQERISRSAWQTSR